MTLLKQPIRLTTTNHDRDIAGMTYVYPVVSRRAGGVSVGINLNPNNACNWRCIYCQVPGLARGAPAAIDLACLEQELHDMLAEILAGEFMTRSVPSNMQRLNDIALSGNGEPTCALEFPEVIDRIGRVMDDFELTGKIKLVLITNGSMVFKTLVQNGLRRMAQLNGEVWFKFDRATRAGLNQINDTETNPERHFQHLKMVASICPTWIQSCFFNLDGKAPDEEEIEAWLDMLARAKQESLPLQGVLLYGLARASLQPEAARLTPLSEKWMLELGSRIEKLGWSTKVSP